MIKTAKKKMIYGLLVLSVSTITMFNACVHQPYVRPVATNDTTGNNNNNNNGTDTGLCFQRDILPIFVSNCAKSGCHDAASHEDGYVLDNYANIIRRGITPGRPGNSKIWESVAEETGDDRMPKNAPALTALQLSLLNRWITEGAKDSGACSGGCDTTKFTYGGTIAPMMQKYCIGCHNSATAPGGNFNDYNTVKNAAVTGRLIGNISRLPGYSAMPPAMALSECQITQMKKWVAAGALNN